jgi:hypothetical protein
MSEYERNKTGLKNALLAVETYVRLNKDFSAKIFCSETNQEVWSTCHAN